jgi:amidase
VPTRRDFVRSSLLAAAALQFPGIAAPASAHASAPPNDRPHAQRKSPTGFELEDLTLEEISHGLSNGRWTSHELIEKYLGRISAMDHAGPALHAMIETNPDIEAIATALDAERHTGHVRGPLHGVPIIVKDNIGTADRMHTSAGSLALATSIAPRDAFVIERLRAAGAIIVGKSNMSEWSSFRSTHPSSGWSARGGQGKNPYALDRSPAGSSSGSAAAVAASYAAAAIGTETDGSIVCPSSACSVVGLKPTVGLISRSGIIPVSDSQDTPGPIARSVTDVAILLNVLTGIDATDPATIASRGNTHADYRSFLDADGLKGARIGIARPTFHGYSAELDARNAIDALESAGAIVEITDIPHVDEYAGTENLVLLYEFKAGINAYLASLGADVPCRSLKDLIDFNAANAREELLYFGQELFEAAENKGSLDEKEYRQARAANVRLSRTEGLDAVFDKYRLDAIVSPTMPPAWLIDLVNGDPAVGTSSSPAAVSGYPSITVPIGYQHGLPVGLSFIGRPWSEGILVKYAFALESLLRIERPPAYHATADLDG